MSDYSAAIKVILAHEGGLVDNPNDHGGITNFGLTIPWLNAHADCQKYAGHPGPWTPDDVRLMTKAMASLIYKECMWDIHGYGNIGDTLVATKVFDMAVNFGEMRGEKFMQRAVNALGFQPPLMCDGNLGPKSFAAINSFSTDEDRQKLLRSCCDLMTNFYNAIVERDPTQKVFIHGWLERAQWPF